jgi:two-component system cell cycle sensor histidine kinase/response regulator CckA
VVKQAGGHIWAYSELGKGSTFKLYFPRIDLRADPAIHACEDILTEGGSETILLVEDDDSLRELTAILLRDQGFNVLEANEGKQALICKTASGPH